MTNEKNQIVENPLLLTELFSGGLYVIPEKKTGINDSENVVVNNADKITSAPAEKMVESVEIQTTENINSIEEIAENKLTIKFELIHLVDTLGDEICPDNWSVAIGNISKAIEINGVKLSENQFTIIPLIESQKASSINEFIESLSALKIIVWSETALFQDWKDKDQIYKINHIEILWLPNFKVVSENDANKRVAWLKIKNFFK